MEEGERKEPEERYLPESHDTPSEFAPVRSFQPSLARKARFTSFIFLKPRPPRVLGVQREFQDFGERFLVSEKGKPHHKFLNDLSNWLKMLWEVKRNSLHMKGW
jgi:hypothetical protein